MGEPGAVPAGVYGAQVARAQSAWTRLESKVVPFPTVRAVLSAVEAGRVDAGIVYRTDAIDFRRAGGREPLARRTIPYLDISYPAAVIAGFGSCGASGSSNS